MSDDPTGNPTGIATVPCPLTHSDAAYVLGALSPTERLEFERHLPGCSVCRRSVAQLAGLPGLLARVPVEQVEAPLPFEPLPETVLPALVAAVRREQRRKTVLITLGSAAAVAVVTLGVTALQATRDDDAPPPSATSTSTSPTVAPARPMEVVVDYGVSADVSLTPVTWGTKVSIICRYSEHEGDYGSSRAYRYNLVAFTRSGKVEGVGSWKAKPGTTYVGSAETAVKLEQITRLEVQSAHGETILRLVV
jgi:hypothetical protein